jgi:hypothetical protein
VTGVAIGTVVISYSVTNICNTAVATTTISVVSAPTAGTISGPNNVCVAANITLTDGVSGGAWTTTTGKASVSSGGVVTGVTAGLDTIVYTVFYPCGSASATYAVTVNPLAIPGTISGPSVVCLGSSITLISSVSGGTWSATNANATVSTGGVVTGVVVGIDTIRYGVTNGCGTVYATAAVNINPIVAPALTFTASPGFTSCNGNSVTYTTIPVNGGATPAYAWSINGSAVGTGTTLSYVPVNGDIISCVMTSSAACLSAPTATYSATATVLPYLTPAVSISTGAYGDTVCVGTLTPFTAAPVNGGSTPTYQWSVNGASAGTGVTFTYTPNNGDVISCVLTSSYLCPMPTTASSNNITMTVDVTEVPAVNISVSPGSTVCAGSPAVFSAHPLYGGVPPAYRWTKNGVNVATGPNYIYAPAAGDNVYCVMTSSSTCIAPGLPDTFVSNILTMASVTPVTQSVVINSATGNVIGAGLNAYLTAVVTPLTAGTTYQWYVNGTAVAGATNGVYILNEPTTTTDLVSCLVNTGDACNLTAASNLLNISFTTGIESISGAGDIRLMPNPNTGSFVVEGTLAADAKDATLEIIDVLGQVIYKDVVSVQGGAISQKVDLHNQPANGMYMLRLTSGEGQKVIRFTINK